MRSASYALLIACLASVFCILSATSVGQTAPNVSPVANPPADEAKNVSRNNTPGGEEENNDAADVPHVSFDQQLQAQVQDALGKVPELSNDSVQVAASSDGLELTGNVATGHERQAAVRIAQSFARGRKVVDHIVVNSRSVTAAEPPRGPHQANSQP